jgi:hypothetical protein
MTTEPSPIATNVEHLTVALHRSGVLGDGRIVSVVVESSRTTVLLWIVRLRLTYAGAQRAHPQDCALRPINSDVECGAAAGGVYTDVAGATPARVVPRCFEAVWDKVTKCLALAVWRI